MAGKKKFLLRLEGVNHANIIDDTDQLSVRRGGGLMLLNVANKLHDLLPKNLKSSLKSIATGASIGLFEFDAADDTDAENVRKQIEELLANTTLPYTRLNGEDADEDADEDAELPLRHATFVVDVACVTAEAEADQQAEQRATAANRWRQLRQPTLSLHQVWGNGTEPCRLDRTRTATAKIDLPEDPEAPVAESTRDRREYGRGARQRFYKRELDSIAVSDRNLASILKNSRFTDDLKELSGAIQTSEGQNVASMPPKHLLNKIAVFYVDGNKFGKKGRDIFAAQGADGYRQWSEELRTHHQKLLGGLLQLADAAPGQWKNGTNIRLETLLWGGDEIIWVLPAWLGWEVAKWFFAQPHQVIVNNETFDLTYACGLVFCNSKAPIKNTTALARRLGDLAKNGRPEKHSLAYEVLESFDDISGDLESHRKRFLPAKVCVKLLVIDPVKLTDNWSDLVALANCNELPMRQLYMLCKHWRELNNDKPQVDTAHVKRIQAAVENSGIKIAELVHSLGETTGWLHLLQMLPYLPIETKTGVEVNP